MHIPACETTELELIRFAPALEEANRPSPDYDSKRWLYVPNVYSEYRYILGTRGEHPLICIGINPSTAAPDRLDNTLKSVERVALYNGFHSFMMFNVYAQRATNPDDMELTYNAELHQENLKAFDYALSLDRGGAPAIWAAWGTIIEKRPYLPQCVQDMIQVGSARSAVWYSAGKRSKKGHPHHPLYLRKDSVLEPFDAQSYIAGLRTASAVSDHAQKIRAFTQKSEPAACGSQAAGSQLAEKPFRQSLCSFPSHTNKGILIRDLFPLRSSRALPILPDQQLHSLHSDLDRG